MGGDANKSKLMDGSDDVRTVQAVVLGAFIIISSIPPCMQHAMPVWILNPLICEATSLVLVVLLLVLKYAWAVFSWPKLGPPKSA
jgi:hypothetical protein